MALERLALTLLKVYSGLIMARVAISWFNPRPTHEALLWVIRLTEPVLGPIRSLIPLRNIDLSPIVAWLLIQFLMKLIYQAGA